MKGLQSAGTVPSSDAAVETILTIESDGTVVVAQESFESTCLELVGHISGCTTLLDISTAQLQTAMNECKLASGDAPPGSSVEKAAETLLGALVDKLHCDAKPTQQPCITTSSVKFLSTIHAFAGFVGSKFAKVESIMSQLNMLSDLASTIDHSNTVNAYLQSGPDTESCVQKDAKLQSAKAVKTASINLDRISARCTEVGRPSGLAASFCYETADTLTALCNQLTELHLRVLHTRQQKLAPLSVVAAFYDKSSAQWLDEFDEDITLYPELLLSFLHGHNF